MDYLEVLRQQEQQQKYIDTLNLEICYSRLHSAYMAKSKIQMLNLIKVYQNMFPSNISEIRESITNEFLANNLPRPSFLLLFQPTHYEVELNTLGCMKAIETQLSRLKYYETNYTYATEVLYKPQKGFEPQQVIYPGDKGNLTVSDLLSVSKYAVKVAQAISPNNENYDKANAVISVFQGIDAVLNNKPEDKPTNKMLHLVNDFLTGSVKSCADKKEEKGGIIVGSTLVDLAIDFLCKK